MALAWVKVMLISYTERADAGKQRGKCIKASLKGNKKVNLSISCKLHLLFNTTKKPKGAVIYGVFSLTGRKESQGRDPVCVVPVSHYTQILFNLGVTPAALWSIAYSVLAHSETLNQPKSAPQAVVTKPQPETPVPPCCDAPGCSNNLSPLSSTALVTAQAQVSLEAENGKREAMLNKLHSSQFPRTFLSSGESICEAFPGPVCWLGLAAPQFPWE